MRGKLWSLDRRLRHAASRFQDSSFPTEYHDWMDCVRIQKSLSVCDSLLTNTTKISFTQGEEYLFNGTVISVNSSTKPPPHIYDDSVRQIYKIVLPMWLTACVISLVFNIIIVFSVRWIRKSLSPTLYLSLSLAVADAYASVVLGLGFVFNTLLPIVYGINLGIYNDCYGLILEAFRLAGVVVAVLHLLALAINHYIGILRPLHYAAIVTKRTVFWVIGAIWLLPNIFFFAYFSLVPEDGFQSPYCSKYDFLIRIPFRAIFSMLFFLPLICMSVMYSHMFVVVKRHQRGMLQLPSSRQLHKSVKAIITTLLILGTYLLGWMPAVLYFILTCLECPIPFQQLTVWVRVPVGIFINSMIVMKNFVDPIIYVVRMPEIKGALRRLYRTRCGFVEEEQDHSLHGKSELYRLTTITSQKKKENNSPNGCVGGEL